MAAVGLVDFSDIYTAVMEELKIPVTDLTTLARVKRNINMVYQNLVANHTEWPWLLKRTDVVHKKYHANGTSDTASVTEDSATVTLSAVPSASLGSFVGYYFLVSSGGSLYTISAHTAGSATVTLSVPYQESTNATAGFKIWTDKIDLPTDASKMVGMRHDRSSYDLIPKGSQKFDEIAQIDRSRLDTPRYYSLDDYYDPSTGDAETESDRYRRVRIFPALYDEDLVLHIDYTQEVTALDADGDEPVMPMQDRIVLFYGALMQSWIRDRNPETAQLNATLFAGKLSSMAAKLTRENPRLEVDDGYMSARRSRRNRRG